MKLETKPEDKMRNKTKKQQSKKLVKPLDSDQNESYNFDLWAREVKRQMIAALQKRASK